MTSLTSKMNSVNDTDSISKRSSKFGYNKAKSNKSTKAWSSEDERILLQGRIARVPYKQIGARLGKSDLACRMHVHQMVMAKKAPDAQPGRSIVFLSSEHPPEVHRLTPTIPNSCLNSPNTFHSFPPSYRPPEQGPDIPLPHGDELHRGRLSSCLGMDSASPLRVWQPISSPYIPFIKDIQKPSPIDSESNENVYEEHAPDLWSTVRVEYPSMDQLTPSRLEHDLFCAISAGNTVTAGSTSNHSPSQSTASTLFKNPSPDLTGLWNDRNNKAAQVERLSVESLLNHRG